MRMPESFFSKVVLAYLPLMACYDPGLNHWCVAALITTVYWAALFIFWFLNRLFPYRATSQVFLLCLALLGQLFWQATGLMPFWILSVYLLFPSGFLEEGKKGRQVSIFSKRFPRYFFEHVMTGAGFFIFAGIFDFSERISGKMGHVVIGENPAGVFFLLFLTAYFWKNQPARARNPSERSTREARP